MRRMKMARRTRRRVTATARAKKKYFWVTETNEATVVAGGGQTPILILQASDWAVMAARETIMLKRIIVKGTLFPASVVTWESSIFCALALMPEGKVLADVRLETTYDENLILWHDVIWRNQNSSDPKLVGVRMDYELELDLQPGRIIANNQEVVLAFRPSHVDADMEVSAVSRCLLAR